MLFSVKEKGSDTLEILFQIAIGYLALYIVIWMHEVGHSFFYWKFGCKKNFLHVTVKPYLFFSTPKPVNDEKCQSLNSKQIILIGYGGIIVNFFSAFIAAVFIKCFTITNEYILLFVWNFCSLHIAELVSYLLIGNIYLVSDMKCIADENRNLRIVNLIMGIFLCIAYIFLLIRIPARIRTITFVFNCMSLLFMGIGRIVFTYRAQKHV